MTRTFLNIFPLFLFALSGRTQTPAIGYWRDHLPYHQAVALSTGPNGKVFCATPYSLFSVDPSDNSIERYSKSNGLSESGISAICYDPNAGKLTIAYNSSNIDIRTDRQSFNIPDIRLSTRGGNKMIYRAIAYNNKVYLSSSLGIIVLDEDKYEIKDTYVVGTDGDTISVFALAADNDHFYAATTEGLKWASLESPDLADYHNWSLMPGITGPCRQVISLSGRILVLENDSVYLQDNGSWNLIYTSGWRINDLSVSGDRLLVCEEQAGIGRVTTLSTAGEVQNIFQGSSALRSPRQAILVDGTTWVADSLTGLSAWNSPGSSPAFYIPSSPASITTGAMTVYRDPTAEPGDPGILWVTSGGVDSNWSPLNDHNGLYRLDKDGWTNYNRDTYAAFNGIFDFDAIAWAPRDTSIWAGSFGKGLLQVSPGPRFSIYAAGSPITSALDDPAAYRISGIAFDKDGNGWMSSYGSAKELILHQADGSWSSFSIPFPHPENAVSQVLVDDQKLVWIASPKGNGLFCYDPGASLNSASDDRWKYYKRGAGNGNLPDDHVYCMAKDRSGFIWVGTANGIGVVQCAGRVFDAAGCDAVWPVVQFDNFAGYLFGGQAVQAIAVDGADRKWIGTRNGIWLITPDAQKIIYHFTADSTPLLSNDVRNISIDPVTGEVFFATAAGICSFRSTATEGGERNENVLIFPNPVPPGYTGTIAIRGLVDGAIVKIVTPDGRLIYQTNALGGQAVWDGRDYKGRKIVTGVYLVLISDDTRHEKASGKIIFIGK